MKPAPTLRPVAPPSTLTPAQCDTLEALLSDLENHARAAAILADAHRAAISTADAANIARCTSAQQQSAAQLTALEARRAAFLRSLGLRQPASITLTQLASLAPAPRAATLTTLARRVRAALTEAAQRRESVRLASLSLMAHMQSLIRQISRHLSETKTYTPHHLLTATSRSTTAGSLDFTT